MSPNDYSAFLALERGFQPHATERLRTAAVVPGFDAENGTGPIIHHSASIFGRPRFRSGDMCSLFSVFIVQSSSPNVNIGPLPGPVPFSPLALNAITSRRHRISPHFAFPRIPDIDAASREHRIRSERIAQAPSVAIAPLAE